MALQPVGARLVLDNESGFLNGFKKANRAVDAFGKDTDKVGVKTIALGNIMANLATGGLKLVADGFLAVGRATTDFLGDSIGKAADLQSQMSSVQAVLGGSNEELAELNDLVTDLGLDPNLKVTSFEAAQAIEVLAKNGLSVSEILDGATKSTVALSNATGADFAVAADIATDAMSQFGISAAEMETAIDGITGVTTSSKFDINDYRLAIGQAGKIAAETGISFDDFNTIISATASSFSSGSDAGTSLKTSIQRLANPTDEAKALMDELGISLFDAEGNTREMSDVVGQLNSAFGGMTNAQKAQTAAMLGGADASRTFLALASLTKEEFIALSGQVNAGGQAFESARLRMDNFQGAMEILDGVIETVKLQIGNAFLPILTDLAEQVTEFVSANAEPFINFFQTGADAVAEFVAALQIGLSPFEAFMAVLDTFLPDETIARVWSFVDSVNGVINTVSTFVGEHAEAFKGAFIGIGAVLASGVITAAISGIIALVGGLVAAINPLILVAAVLGAAWGENWFGIRDKTAEVINFIQPLITDAITNIKTWWTENSDAILAKALEVWGAVQNFLLTTWTILQTEFNAFVALFRGDWDGFLSGIQTAWTMGWDLIVQTLTGLWELVQPHLLSFYTSVQTWFTTTDWQQLGIDAINFIKEGLAQFWELVQPTIESWYESVKDFLLETDWEGVGTDVVEKIDAGINTLDTLTDQSLTDWFNDTADWFEGQDWEGMGKTAGNLVGKGLGAIFLFVTEVLPNFFQDVMDSFKSPPDFQWTDLGVIVSDGFVEGFLNMLESAKQAAADFVSGFVDGFKEALEAKSPSQVFLRIGQDVIQGLIDGLSSMVDDVVSEATSIGKSMMEGMIDGIKSKVQSLIDTAKGAVGSAIDAAKGLLGIQSPSTVFAAIGQDIVGGLVMGIEGATPQAISSISGLIEAVTNQVPVITLLGLESTTDPGLQAQAADIGAMQDRLGILRDINALNEQSARLAAGGFGAAEFISSESGVAAILEQQLHVQQQLFDQELARSALTAREGVIGAQEKELSGLQSINRLNEQIIKLTVERGVGGLAILDPDASRLQILEQQRKVNEQLLQQERERISAAVGGQLLQQAQDRFEIAQAEADLQGRQAQLKFLQDQQKLLADIAAAGLDPAAILGGFQVGLDADQAGFLQAMSNFTDALIAQAQADLGISSPSKVFMNMGKQITAGLASGIMNTMRFPERAAQSMTRAVIRPPASSSTIINNSAQNNTFNMTVQDRMDAAMLQIMIQRSLGATIS